MQNIDGRPPRFLKQFTLQQLPAHTFPIPTPGTPPPAHLYILPSPSPLRMTLLTTPPLQAHTFCPLQFLFDAPSPPPSLPSPSTSSRWLAPHSKGKPLERADTEDARIVRFVRTPEGRGVGVLREKLSGAGAGQGETWIVEEERDGDGARIGLRRGRRWESGDLVVVLDGGT